VVRALPDLSLTDCVVRQPALTHAGDQSPRLSTVEPARHPIMQGLLCDEINHHTNMIDYLSRKLRLHF
jgi:hypothetical protein